MIKSTWLIPFALLLMPLIWPFKTVYVGLVTAILIFTAIALWVCSGKKCSTQISWTNYKARLLHGWQEIKHHARTERQFRQLLIAFGIAALLLTLAAPPLGISGLLITVHFVLAGA